MKTYDFVHLAFHALNGEIRGSTKLQKTLYFLGILTDSVDELGYRPHFYGPYSDAVASSVNQLKSIGFVQQATLHTGAVNSAGFEIARQDFSLTDEGKEVAEQKRLQFPDDWAKLTSAVAILKDAGEIDYMKMSVAAKAYYMLKSKGEAASARELSELAKKLGWDPSPSEIADSIVFLEKLRLVMAKPK